MTGRPDAATGRRDAATGPTESATGGGSAPRRELTVAVLACLAGAALALLAATRPWATAMTAATGPAGPSRVTVTGAAAVPVIRGLGLLALAGSVALLATRRTGRRLLGAVLALAGAGLVAGALAGRADPGQALREAAAEVTGRTGAEVTAVAVTGWPWLAAVAGLLVAASGLIAAIRGGRWSELSSRYRRPDPDRPAPAADATAQAWDALDRGRDPTV